MNDIHGLLPYNSYFSLNYIVWLTRTPRSTAQPALTIAPCLPDTLTYTTPLRVEMVGMEDAFGGSISTSSHTHALWTVSSADRWTGLAVRERIASGSIRIGRTIAGDVRRSA